MQSQPEPVANRLQALDAVRGFALCGVLLSIVNGFHFTGAYAEQFGSWTHPVDRIWGMTHELIIAQRFISIFSLLFGIGVGIQWARRQAAGQSFAPTFARRMLALAAFGLINTTFFWWGEILLVYAVMGLLLIPLSRAPNWLLLTLAALVFVVANPLWETFVAPHLQGVDAWFRQQYSFEQLVDVYRRGTLSEMVRARWTEYSVLFAYNNQYMRTALALILAGFVIGRSGGHVYFYENLGKFRGWAVLAAVGTVGWLLQGLATGRYFADFADGWARFLIFSGCLLCASFLYIYVLCVLCRRTPPPPIVKPLANLGRMALSNYMLGAAIFSLIYHNNGLGYYNALPLRAELLIAGGVIIFEMLLSTWWLARYRFGPMEWLWRTLAYAEAQPMRLANAAPSAL